MRVIALTGGIGAGKSLAASYLSERGAVVLDLDVLAKPLLDQTAVRAQLVEEFGEAILDDNRRIDRVALAHAAFRSAEGTARLNAILHPLVLGEVTFCLDELALLGHPPRAVVLEVPLLVEAPEVARLADVVVAIAASPEIRLARCAAKGLDEDDARTRMERQASDEQRASVADVVIDNEGSPQQLYAALDAFWDREVAAE